MNKRHEKYEKMKEYDRKFNYKHLIRSLLCDKQCNVRLISLYHNVLTHPFFFNKLIAPCS